MKNNNTTTKNDFRILGIRIPVTMDLSFYGNQFYSEVQDSTNIIWIRKKNSKNVYKISQSELTNEVKLIQSNKGIDNILISFIDIRKEGDPLNTFTRKIKLPHNKVYNFVEGIKTNS